MFFRFKKSGERSYVQVVENKRVDGVVRQSVIGNLGRADELTASGALASLLAAGAKLTDQVLLINALDEDADGALSVSAKRIGGPLLFGKIWERLGVADVLGKSATPASRFSTSSGTSPEFGSDNFWSLVMMVSSGNAMAGATQPRPAPPPPWLKSSLGRHRPSD
jgi:hypothetical protein